MITKISDNIWKLSFSSNLYFLDFEEKIIIDAGDRKDHQEIKQFLSKIVDFNKVNKVLFTHLHYDHIGNFDLFPNAKFYASGSAIDTWKKDAYGTILNENICEKFKNTVLHELKDMNNLKVINTPGHTIGSICLWYEPEKILFSGDTLFAKGLGRTDLPTSSPDEMHQTILKLLSFNHKILCPGHDY